MGTILSKILLDKGKVPSFQKLCAGLTYNVAVSCTKQDKSRISQSYIFIH